MRLPLFALCFLLLAGAASASDLKERTRGYAHFRRGVALMMDTERSLIEAFGDPARVSVGDDYAPLEPDDRQVAAFRQAIAEFEAAALLIPDEEEVYVFLANAHWSLNQLDKTVSFFAKAITLNPARDDVISARVTALLELGRTREAEGELERLRALDSEFTANAESAIEERKANKAVDPTPGNAPQNSGGSSEG